MPLHRSQSRTQYLVAALAFIPPVAFLSAIPWLKQQPDFIVFLLAGVAATLTVSASFALAILKDRDLDEWHRSAARFSSQWGWLAGSSIVALLLAVPPVLDGIVSLAGSLARVAEPNQKLVVFAFIGGFVAVVLAQTLCTFLLSLVWRWWMSREAS